ncbi:hypothetical protein BDQ17DRAFT_1492247 [Cyathus striatus]|nr:hypothetical protein BDQ17DRAFT_1492247 [Cyathus striatus]
MKQRVQGPHFACIDPRVHGNKTEIIAHARHLFQVLLERGCPWDDIIISIPATEAGIHAAAHLREVDDVNVNLYLVSNLIHAAACIEAGVASISIPVGPLLDASERSHRKGVSQNLVLQTGIDDIRCILAYLRLNRVVTKAIGTEFREMAEIGLLSDFDAVCIAPEQIDRLRWSNIPIESSDTASAVNLRASQAQFPTTYLKAGERFMSSSMSLNSRKLTNFILEEELGRLIKYMELIEDALFREFERQIKLFHKGEEIYRPLKESLEVFFRVQNRAEAEKLRPVKKEASFTTGFGTLQLTDQETEEVF